MGLPNLLENKQKYNLLKLAMNIVSIQVFQSHNAKVVYHYSVRTVFLTYSIEERLFYSPSPVFTEERLF